MLDTLARTVHDAYSPPRGQQTSLHLDFETYSEAPLKICGGYRYAVDKTTEVLIACFAVDKGDVYHWIPCITVEQAREHHFPNNQFWFYGPKVPDMLARLVADHEHTTIVCHNASFERAIWQAQVMRKHGGPSSKPKQFKCTAATAAEANLPRSLDGVGMALDSKQKKDVENGKLVKTFCMPRKPTKNDPRTRVMPLDDVDAFKRFVSYCNQDVRTERNVEKLLPPLHPAEQKLFTFDMQINERGLRIDIPLVRKAASIVARLERDIVEEVKRRTITPEYPEGLRPTQRDKMLTMFHNMGVKLENMQADHVRRYMKLNASTMSQEARELLMLRIEAGKSSTKKFASMLAYCAEDHRARGTLLFAGASTGRWCVSEGTEVLVRTPGIANRGRARLRRIENILPTDQLWDGNEWVGHEGVVASGKKLVLQYDDVTATAQHEVWVDDQRKVKLEDASELGLPIWQSWPAKCNMKPEPSKVKAHGKVVKTYDVVNAGPRNRFTLMNGRVVSNSGRGLQPQNFIRGNLKYEEQLRIFSLLAHDDHELMSMLYEWPISAISSCMRGFIIPSPGKILRVVDYAAIEARVLAWLAEEAWVLQAYIDGLDVYRLMAAGVFNMTYEEVGKDSNERRIGKNLILGCFGGGTEVLTSRGWVKIVEVQLTDTLWDGTQWVSHSGVICQGLKEVISLDGVEVTPDHKVWNGLRWSAASDILEDSKSFQSALRSVKLPFELISLLKDPDLEKSNTNVIVGASHMRPSSTLLGAPQPDAAYVLYAPLQTEIEGKAGDGTLIQSRDSSTGHTKFWKEFMGRKLIGWRTAWNVGLRISDRVGSMLRSTVANTAMTVDVFRLTCQTPTPHGFKVSGVTCTGANGFSLTVKAALPSVVSGVHCDSSSKMLDNFRGTGQGQTDFNSTGLTLSEGTSQLTADSVHKPKISETKQQTYDITNCGPNSRFVIRTRSGSLIVHNCGYGLGAAKFVAYSEKAGVEIQESFAKTAVKAYRTKHRNIIRFWYDVERCAITAVRERRTDKNPVVLRNLKFYCKDQWFCVELPNERCLRYYRPRVVAVEKFDEPGLQLQFKTEFRGKLVTESTYGGKLTENIVQAVARDILVCGMFNAEAAGYTVIGTVHDELLTEQLPEAGSVHELEKIVCILPEWAKGLPLKAEGFESYRYRK